VGEERGKSTQKAFRGPEQLNFSSVDMKGFGFCDKKT